YDTSECYPPTSCGACPGRDPLHSTMLRAAPAVPPQSAAAARGAGCHVGALGAAPDSSAMTGAAHCIFLCAPTIVDTHPHLQHECSKGTITTDKASNIPLQRSLQFYIVHT